MQQKMSGFEFFSAIWGADGEGNLSEVHFIAEPTGHGWRHHPVSTVMEALAKAGAISEAGHNAYFACAEYLTGENRKGDNAAGARAFWLDIDCGEVKAAAGVGYPRKRDATDALQAFCGASGMPIPSIIVDSGNGLHCYWTFAEFIPRDQWRALARKLKSLAARHGFRADPARTADIASVLRVPGTLNWKDPENPKPVTLKRLTGHVGFDAFCAVLDAVEPDTAPFPAGKPSVNPFAAAVAEYPPSSAHKIVERCDALRQVAEAKGNVEEPLWRAMLGVVKRTVEGEALCHEWSSGHPEYDANETQAKIDGWTTGPTTCEYFKSLAPGACGQCRNGCASPIQLGVSEDRTGIDAALGEMNARYSAIKIGSGVFVCDEQDTNILAGAMTFAAFQQLHAGRVVDGKKVAATWLNWSERRTYSALVFDPSGRAPDGVYNTWRGLAVTPRAGECGRILNHIREVWCSGKSPQFEYVIRWLAMLVQRPWEKPEVALVLRSREGTGKTIIVQMLLRIFGPHGFTAAQKDQVAGRFNGHLFDKVLVVLEEALFAGDPAAVAAIKALVTNSLLGYESKGKDAFSAPNFAHGISMTNYDWAVPGRVDVRRWMVLDVSDARRGDHAYFRALAAEIENGGTEAFLAHLLAIDLTGWNPRALPESEALRAQQRETMMRTDPVAAWWFHVLAEGTFTVEGGAVDWAAEIPASDVQESYMRMTARARGAPAWDAAAKKLRHLVPPGALGRARKSTGGGRAFYYALPDLDSARAHFKLVTGVDPCEA